MDLDKAVEILIGLRRRTNRLPEVNAVNRILKELKHPLDLQPQEKGIGVEANEEGKVVKQGAEAPPQAAPIVPPAAPKPPAKHKAKRKAKPKAKPPEKPPAEPAEPADPPAPVASIDELKGPGACPVCGKEVPKNVLQHIRTMINIHESVEHEQYLADLESGTAAEGEGEDD